MVMRSKWSWLGVVSCALALGGACGDSGDTPGGMAGAGVGVPNAGMNAATAGEQATAGNGAPVAGNGVAGNGVAGNGVAGAGVAGTGPTLPPGECATSDDIMTGAMCADNANGVFAIKTVVDVWWQDPDQVAPLIDAGRDKITVYLMGNLSGVCPDGSNGTGIMKGCGTELPPFKSDTNCDVFQIEFPHELWDKPTMPTFMTTGSTTGFNPGDILSIATATGLVGIDLTDPNGTWPTAVDNSMGRVTCAAGTSEQCFPDHDGDGKPGITVKMGKIGQNFSTGNCGGFFMLDFVYRGAPLDAISALDDNSVRAETIYIGLRTRLGGGGAIGSDCSSGSGDSTAEFLDSRVIGCERTDNQPCTLPQAQFVDGRAPFYNILLKDQAPPPNVRTMGANSMPLDPTPSAGPRSALVCLGDEGQTFPCADVRNAPFPAL
jgi:hypothetical protein